MIVCRLCELHKICRRLLAVYIYILFITTFVRLYARRALYNEWLLCSAHRCVVISSSKSHILEYSARVFTVACDKLSPKNVPAKVNVSGNCSSMKVNVQLLGMLLLIHLQTTSSRQTDNLRTLYRMLVVFQRVINFKCTHITCCVARNCRLHKRQTLQYEAHICSGTRAMDVNCVKDETNKNRVSVCH